MHPRRRERAVTGTSDKPLPGGHVMERRVRIDELLRLIEVAVIEQLVKPSADPLWIDVQHRYRIVSAARNFAALMTRPPFPGSGV
jgi:hypothetical protein